MFAGVHFIRMRCAAVAAEMQGGCAFVRCCRVLAGFFLGFAYQGVHQNDALAAAGFGERRPPRTIRPRFPARRCAAGAAEVLQERHIVVLATSSAGGDGEVRELFFSFFKGRFVLGGKPQFWLDGSRGRLGTGRERDHGTADAAHEGVNHGPQQRPAAATGRRRQREPRQDFGFGDGATDVRAQGFGQVRQRLRSFQLLVQPIGDLVVCQRFVQRFWPSRLRRAQTRAGEGVVCAANQFTGFVFHRRNAIIQQSGGVFLWPRRDGAFRRPYLRFVVLLHRFNSAFGNAEETRREVPRRPGVQPVHDGGGGGDANGAVSIRAAEHPQPTNETRGFRT